MNVATVFLLFEISGFLTQEWVNEELMEG